MTQVTHRLETTKLTAEQRSQLDVKLADILSSHTAVGNNTYTFTKRNTLEITLDEDAPWITITGEEDSDGIYTDWTMSEDQDATRFMFYGQGQGEIELRFLPDPNFWLSAVAIAGCALGLCLVFAGILSPVGFTMFGFSSAGTKTFLAGAGFFSVICAAAITPAADAPVNFETAFD